MPVVPGKPGTLRYRGVLRAQLGKGSHTLNSILNYNTKIAARVPPISFLTGPQVTTLQTASLLLQQLLTVKN